MKDTNNKLFSEEDFDKPTQQGNWFSEHIKQIILGALVIVCIVLVAIFVPRGCTNGKVPVADTLVTDTTSNDSVTSVVKDTVSADSAKTAGMVDEAKPNVDTKASNEDNKTEGSKTATQVNVRVTEDVEKEALSVIRGNYGNNPNRRRLLKERYQEIQNKVNEMYRNGQVK